MLFLQWNSFSIKRDVQLREEILSRVLSHDLNQENNIISEHTGYFLYFCYERLCANSWNFSMAMEQSSCTFGSVTLLEKLQRISQPSLWWVTSVCQRVPHGFEAWASKQDFWCRDYGKGDNLQLRSKATSLATWDVRFVHNKTFGTSHLQKKELPSKRGPLLKWCHLSEMN